ncbi:hypothetical protein FGO68_gene7800 [Halteria grandinella]|uniref:60S ribosomal protein L13 n=1 Tax=Halteria grandinella TaxID=5974 RepID=A0A8J8T0J8_HALGN|nr:hypothetical protein FGO68_gene7800 [Halteria grandinella]
MVKHNYQLPNAHFRKHWSRFVKSWFDQPANKKRRVAAITPAFAQTVGIAVDHRRHDLNEQALQLNVQRLESYKSKLILFPRRADKPKKGPIADSTGDKLKNVSQNTVKHVIAKPARKLRQAPQKITKELTGAKIYRKLRQLRVNEKYLGKREKKAKEAAEKEK